MANPRNLLEEAASIASQVFAAKPTPETMEWHLYEFLMETFGEDWLYAALARHNYGPGHLYSATLIKMVTLFSGRCQTIAIARFIAQREDGTFYVLKAQPL